MSDEITIIGAGGLGREVLATLEAAEGFLVEQGCRADPVGGLPVRDEPKLGSVATRFVIAFSTLRLLSARVLWSVKGQC